ncbi:hypothetical protein AVEN_119588-1 [Araneus ventricosus]|uniref:Uncharacterized protein n=1 Tax=Araneus ventricosus TaxID=182803 RepID=A0A4Y2TMJ4_ARAVE|nr:hypothetical protein AVEN_119588-1 [Araneus ventricosus]
MYLIHGGSKAHYCRFDLPYSSSPRLTHTEDFRVLEKPPSPPRPDFSSLTTAPLTFPFPNALSTYTGDLSPALKDHLSFLWPSIPMDNQSCCSSNSAVCLC